MLKVLLASGLVFCVLKWDCTWNANDMHNTDIVPFVSLVSELGQTDSLWKILNWKLCLIISDVYFRYKRKLVLYFSFS